MTRAIRRDAVNQTSSEAERGKLAEERPAWLTNGTTVIDEQRNATARIVGNE